MELERGDPRLLGGEWKILALNQIARFGIDQVDEELVTGQNLFKAVGILRRPFDLKDFRTPFSEGFVTGMPEGAELDAVFQRTVDPFAFGKVSRWEIVAPKRGGSASRDGVRSEFAGAVAPTLGGIGEFREQRRIGARHEIETE